MEENIIILDYKIHFYEQLYKSWCKKIDSNMKNIVKKINDLDKRIEKLENNYNDQIKIIKHKNLKLEEKFKKHQLKLKKNNEIIILLYKKINQKSYIGQIETLIYNHFQNNILFHKILFYIKKFDRRISMFILFIFFIIYIIYK